MTHFNKSELDQPLHPFAPRPAQLRSNDTQIAFQSLIESALSIHDIHASGTSFLTIDEESAVGNLQTCFDRILEASQYKAQFCCAALGSLLRSKTADWAQLDFNVLDYADKTACASEGKLEYALGVTLYHNDENNKRQATQCLIIDTANFRNRIERLAYVATGPGVCAADCKLPPNEQGFQPLDTQPLMDLVAFTRNQLKL
ncbi:MAG TPA: hypothetical protein VF733_05030 [Candidatus Saccharimonadales bacterium]